MADAGAGGEPDRRAVLDAQRRARRRRSVRGHHPVAGPHAGFAGVFLPRCAIRRRLDAAQGRNAIARILDKYTLADVVAVTLRKLKGDKLDFAFAPFSVDMAKNRASIAALRGLLAGLKVQVVCTGHDGCSKAGVAQQMLDDLIARAEKKG